MNLSGPTTDAATEQRDAHRGQQDPVGCGGGGGGGGGSVGEEGGTTKKKNQDLVRAKVAPSLLSGDWAELAKECRRMIEVGADYLHMDVMDGHFVPNLTIGAPVIKALRKHTDAFLDMHMMVSRPEDWVSDMAAAGADLYCFHVEASGDVQSVIDKVHQSGMKAGLAVKPGTSVDAVLPYAPYLDHLLVMTVEPGFGGQSFMASVLPKVTRLRSLYPDLDIEVDGGVTERTVGLAAEAGANVMVSGSAVFGSHDPGKVVRELKRVTEEWVLKWGRR